MFFVIKNSWALLFGMFLLMLGNGLQGTLLGVRGSIEGMSPQTMSWVMTGYFVGFLFGSQLTPNMIRRVGHVRVFAALGSLVSACLILYAAWTNPYFWFLLRIIVGFCFSGIYVVAESWLNDSSSNETRGQTLSAYLIVQMMGIVLAQAVLNFADPSGYMLFIIISVVVSLSFAPILLSVSPAPQFQTSKRMTLSQLWSISPLGVVGQFFLGAIFAALFGMASVYGTERGLTVKDISLFVAAIYFGGMILQYPIGWVSDRMDRRVLIFIVCSIGTFFSFAANLSDNFIWLLIVAFIIGGVSNPLYSLYIAYTNDNLEHDDMASASGGLIFLTGIGAIFGPSIVGWLLDAYGAASYFWFIGSVMAIMGSYALYRMTQTSSTAVEDTNAYAPITPTSTPVAMELAQEYAIEMALEEEEINQ
jgi:MFS family permease